MYSLMRSTMFLLLGLVVAINLGANNCITEFNVNDEEKKTVILFIKSDNENNQKPTKSETNAGRSLNDTQIYAELHDGILSFEPYNIIGETFVIRIYENEEEESLWIKSCVKSDLSRIVLPSLPSNNYVLTFETIGGIYSSEISL